MNYRIFETNEYYELAKLFDENGLHADPDEGREEDSIALWRCETEDGKLIAGAELIYRAGVYVLQHIAVADEFKGQGFGASLLAVVEEDVKRRMAEADEGGMFEMWLCAKVPEFYKKYEWQEVDRRDAPDFTYCFECEDFGTICNPKVMKKKLI